MTYSHVTCISAGYCSLRAILGMIALTSDVKKKVSDSLPLRLLAGHKIEILNEISRSTRYSKDSSLKVVLEMKLWVSDVSDLF